MKSRDLVLNKTYSNARSKKTELAFRYRMRAYVVADAAKRYLGSSGSLHILDLGAADGKALLELRRLLPNGEYAGIEYSDELVQCTTGMPSEIRIIKGDVTNLPEEIKCKSYNIVSAMALLGHLSRPFEAVSQAAAVLCPGGIFVATCSEPAWETIASRTGLLTEEKHVKEIRKHTLFNLVQKAGLEVLSYERFMWAPVAILPYLKIPIAPSVALKIDKVIRSLRIFNWSFVNQCLIARKPQ